MAFYQATAGTVSIDGVDLEDMAVESLREHLSYVFQETQLFSDSIRDNFRYENPDAPQEEVERAATIASAHDFIMDLPRVIMRSSARFPASCPWARNSELPSRADCSVTRAS